jgi:TonB family protein
MRILVADNDFTMLETLARSLASDFNVDVATSKLSCLAMLEVSEFHVIVCCEQLEDGSGLELLSQAGRRWPDVLRVLAIEPDRAHLLQGRLKPFRLFETLPYPINSGKLRNILMLAQAADDAQVDTMNVQHIVLEDEIRGAEPEPAVAVAAHGGRNAAPTARSAPQRAAPVARPQPQQAPAIPGAMSRRLGQRRAGSERRGTISVSSEPDFAADIDALAEASQIAAAMRPKLERTPNMFGKSRTALFAALGIGAVAVAAAAMMFTRTDSPGVPPVATLNSVQPKSIAAAQPIPLVAEPTASAGDPPEVVAFVADIEAALTVDNFVQARSLLEMLREAAPGHPRLALFEALVARGEELQVLAAERSGSNRVQGEVARASARTATRAGDRFDQAPPAAKRDVPVQRQRALNALTTPPIRAGSALGAASPPPVASPPPAPAPAPAALSNSFSGRTLEDSSGSAQPEVEAPRRATVVLPVVKEAKAVKQVDPEYPRDAMREGIEGTIDLRFTVTTEGKVTDIEVVTANPPETFDRAAIAALRRWRYDPRREDGVAVDSRTRVRLEFKLEDGRGR